MECGICLTPSSRWDELCVEHHRACIKCSLSMRLARLRVLHKELVVDCPFCRREGRAGLNRHRHSVLAENFIMREHDEMTFIEYVYMLFCMAPILAGAYVAICYVGYFGFAFYMQFR